MIKEADLVRALAEQVGLEFVDLTEYQIDAGVHRLAARGPGPPVPRPARSASATASCWWPCPTRRTSTRSTTSAPSPAGTSSRWSPRRTTSSRRSRSSRASTPRSRRSRREAAEATRGRGRLDLEAALEDAPIVKLVNAIMTQAVGDRASDVHIEPSETRRPRPVPRGRRAPRGRCARAEEHPGRADQPPQGHGGPQHRREAHPAGRAHLDEGRRQAARPACRHAADRLRREGRDPRARQVATRCSQLAELGFLRGRRTSGSRRRSASRTARSS